MGVYKCLKVVVMNARVVRGVFEGLDYYSILMKIIMIDM